MAMIVYQKGPVIRFGKPTWAPCAAEFHFTDVCRADPDCAGIERGFILLRKLILQKYFHSGRENNGTQDNNNE